jgi:phosphatidylinositol glycan class P protein
MQQHLAPSRPALTPRPSSPGVTSPAAPLAPFPPLAAKSRAPEIYGFVAWTGTLLGYALFLAWALLPPRALDALGWTWYPAQCVHL